MHFHCCHCAHIRVTGVPAAIPLVWSHNFSWCEFVCQAAQLAGRRHAATPFFVLLLVSPGVSLVLPEVSNFDDWVTVHQLISWKVLPCKLVIISRFDVSSMVLVEVVKLVVNVYWALNCWFDILEVGSIINFTPLWHEVTISILYMRFLVKAFTHTNVVVSLIKLNDSVTHNLEYNTDRQKDDCEQTEGEHGAHGCWNWSPCREGLLLELGLFPLLARKIPVSNLY